MMGRLSKEDMDKFFADLDAPDEPPPEPPPEVVPEPEPAVIVEPVQVQPPKPDDLDGTVRYDLKEDIFLVCSVAVEEGVKCERWDAYVLERHESLTGPEINADQCPIIGNVPRWNTNRL